MTPSLQDVLEARATSLYQAQAGIVDPLEAVQAFLASDVQLRDGYRLMAVREPRMAHADTATRIGSLHLSSGTHCQDYATHGSVPVPYAVVSDGCSSSGRTDLGSRLLCLSAARAMEKSSLVRGDGPAGLEEFTWDVLRRVSHQAHLMGVVARDLDATLGVAVSGHHGVGVTTAILGDGVMAARTDVGLEAVVVDWAGNMPGYPCYLLSGASRDNFVNQSERAARERGRAPCLVSRYLVLPGGGLEKISVEGMSASKGLEGIAVRWSGAQAAFALTDGVCQVGDIPWGQALDMVTTLSTARLGTFASRRLNHALAAMARVGSVPTDDITVGAVVSTTPED